MQHPDIDRIERDGYPWSLGEEEEVLCDEDEELAEEEIWGDEREDDLYEERRERALFGFVG